MLPMRPNPDVTPPDRTVLPRDTALPDRAPTGSASDAGPVICSFPGPIIAARVGATIVTAAAMPMAAAKIRVLMHMLMVRPLLVESLGAERRSITAGARSTASHCPPRLRLVVRDVDAATHKRKMRDLSQASPRHAGHF
jgi:hypothetical protein